MAQTFIGMPRGLPYKCNVGGASVGTMSALGRRTPNPRYLYAERHGPGDCGAARCHSHEEVLVRCGSARPGGCLRRCRCPVSRTVHLVIQIAPMVRPSEGVWSTCSDDGNPFHAESRLAPSIFSGHICLSISGSYAGEHSGQPAIPYKVYQRRAGRK